MLKHQTRLTRLVHLVEDNHPATVHPGVGRRHSIMNATPDEIHMLQVAASELPDGSGQINSNRQLTKNQERFCVYKSRGMETLSAYLKAFRCDYSTAKHRASIIMAKPNIYNKITNLRHGLAL